MISEAVKKLEQMFRELMDYIDKFKSRFDDLLDADSQVRTPYKCRICGHKYATLAEVRDCKARHQRQSAKAYTHGMGKSLYTVNHGSRIVHRNREAMMRSTEIRRFGNRKQ